MRLFNDDFTTSEFTLWLRCKIMVNDEQLKMLKRGIIYNLLEAATTPR